MARCWHVIGRAVGVRGSTANGRSRVPGSSPSYPTLSLSSGKNEGPCMCQANTRPLSHTSQPSKLLLERDLPQHGDCLSTEQVCSCIAAWLWQEGQWGLQSKTAKLGLPLPQHSVTPSSQAFHQVQRSPQANAPSCLPVSCVHSLVWMLGKQRYGPCLRHADSPARMQQEPCSLQDTSHVVPPVHW